MKKSHKKNQSPNYWLVIACELTAVIVLFVASGMNIFTGQISDDTSSSVVVGKIPKPTATLAVLAPSEGKFETGEAQTIKWTSKNYSQNKVSINLLRKVSDDPATYKLVRVISKSTANDGVATWVPALTDVGEGLIIEVACVSGTQACIAGQTSEANGGLAVVKGNRFANTASAYKAIESENNN
jgi:hypothetical protein